MLRFQLIYDGLVTELPIQVVERSFVAWGQYDGVVFDPHVDECTRLDAQFSPDGLGQY